MRSVRHVAQACFIAFLMTIARGKVVETSNFDQTELHPPVTVKETLADKAGILEVNNEKLEKLETTNNIKKADETQDTLENLTYKDNVKASDTTLETKQKNKNEEIANIQRVEQIIETIQNVQKISGSIRDKVDYEKIGEVDASDSENFKEKVPVQQLQVEEQKINVQLNQEKNEKDSSTKEPITATDDNETGVKVVQNENVEKESVNENHVKLQNQTILKQESEPIDVTNKEVSFTEAQTNLNKGEKVQETEAQEKVTTKEPGETEPGKEKTSNSTEQQKISYKGIKVLRVVLRNREQRKMLKQLESKGDINMWSGNGTAVDILVRGNDVYDLFKEKNFLYDVVIDDLQQAIETENPQLPQDDSELDGRKGHRMTWQMYHRMADIHGYIDYLTSAYPDMCSQETIGYSVEGKPLKLLKISSGQPDSKAIWVDSGIHAREWITPASSTYAISQMVENGDGAHGVDWYFLPLVNPDGYEHSHKYDRLWRKNRADAYKGPCAGTDLNRNFGYRWGGQGSSLIPCRETYAGSGPFSEPETSAINKFVSSKSKDLKAYISLHSYGQYILYPWGYDRKVPPDYSDLHRVGRAMAQAMKMAGGQTYKVGSAAATLYPASGGSDDWAKGSAKIKYTYTIELRDTGRYGFILPAQYIVPTAKEAYAALKTLATEVNQL